MSDDKKRYFRVSRNGDHCTMPLEMALEELRESFKGDEPGDGVTFQVVEMTDTEFNALPEFQGW